MTLVTLKVLIVNDIDEWTEETPRDVSLYILPQENTTLIYPRKLQSYANQYLDILILVASDPTKSTRRNAIRATWGKGENHGIKIGLVFILGLTRNTQVIKFFYVGIPCQVCFFKFNFNFSITITGHLLNKSSVLFPFFPT